jgi:hypothetical protein
MAPEGITGYLCNGCLLVFDGVDEETHGQHAD